jgi:hypothetical protein
MGEVIGGVDRPPQGIIGLALTLRLLVLSITRPE